MQSAHLNWYTASLSQEYLTSTELYQKYTMKMIKVKVPKTYHIATLILCQAFFISRWKGDKLQQYKTRKLYIHTPNICTAR